MKTNIGNQRSKMTRVLLKSLGIVGLVVALGCDEGGPQGMPIPENVCVGQSFGGAWVEHRFVCPVGSGGGDGICSYSLGSSDGGILIADNTLYVPESRDGVDVCFPISPVFEGTAELRAFDENANRFVLGSVRVSGSCPAYTEAACSPGSRR